MRPVEAGLYWAGGVDENGGGTGRVLEFGDNKINDALSRVKFSSRLGKQVRARVQHVRCRAVNGATFDVDPSDLIQYTILVTGRWEEPEGRALEESLVYGLLHAD